MALWVSPANYHYFTIAHYPFVIIPEVCSTPDEASHCLVLSLGVRGLI